MHNTAERLSVYYQYRDRTFTIKKKLLQNKMYRVVDSGKVLRLCLVEPRIRRIESRAKKTAETRERKDSERGRGAIGYGKRVKLQPLNLFSVFRSRRGIEKRVVAERRSGFSFSRLMLQVCFFFWADD